jgi:hypothetical protein
MNPHACLCAALLTPLLAFPTQAARAAPSHGLRVTGEGLLTLNGEPFQGVGVNYMGAFQRHLQDAEDTSFDAGFEELGELGIPFARFMAFGFWPKEMRLYEEDREAYWSRMDAVVDSAERHGVGLIPSMFWWYPCVPDLVGESINQWGNPQSETHAFMRQYVKDMVTRYRDSPAIWAWEFGNEYNLAADLPNALDNLPWARPELGTPPERTKADTLTHEDITAAAQAFADEVRKHDPHRAITTGHAIPRSSQYHQRTELSWQPDTRKEFAQDLIDKHPDPIDVLSVHIYPEMMSERYFGRRDATYGTLIEACLAAAEQSGKPLFIGEWGSPDGGDYGTIEEAKREFAKLLATIVELEVPISALWVYDFPFQDDFINVTSTNHRAYQLEAIVEANSKMREEAR